jgi:hypothetical protein
LTDNPAVEVVADGSYAWLLPGVESFGSWLERAPRWARAAATRFGFVRGVLLFVASVRRDRIAVVRVDPGWRTLLLLRALLGRRRKLVVLQFIRHPIPGRFWPRVDRWAVRRAMVVGQVLTEWERGEYARAFGVERFVCVPWPWRRRPASELPAAPAEPMVLASGRAFCDWPTLFAAATGSDWPLVVVCSPQDRQAVASLAVGCGARVLCDLAADEHAALLARATVSVIAMREAGISQGQIRLMDANDAGVAVVATATRSLDGYAVAGQTALLVPPGDAPALRAAVDRLLRDRDERERIRRSAFERSQRWTGLDYLESIAALVHGGVTSTRHVNST